MQRCFSKQQVFPNLSVYLTPTLHRHFISLVALEVDSEEEEDGAEPKTPLAPMSSDAERSEDKGENVHPSPDLTCTRSQSALTPCETSTKVNLVSPHVFVKLRV